MRYILLLLVIMAITGVTAPDILLWVWRIVLTFFEALRPYIPEIVAILYDFFNRLGLPTSL